jgi:hypothetical protein
MTKLSKLWVATLVLDVYDMSIETAGLIGNWRKSRSDTVVGGVDVIFSITASWMYPSD